MQSLHGACPTALGIKWVSNKWIREGAQIIRRPCPARAWPIIVLPNKPSINLIFDRVVGIYYRGEWGWSPTRQEREKTLTPSRQQVLGWWGQRVSNSFSHLSCWIFSTSYRSDFTCTWSTRHVLCLSSNQPSVGKGLTYPNLFSLITSIGNWRYPKKKNIFLRNLVIIILKCWWCCHL